MKRLVVILTGAVAALALPAGAAVAAPAPAAPYRVVDLGTLPGATDSYANAVNDAGLVVGESGLKAVVWKDGRISDLGVRGSSRAVDVNSGGDIAGELLDPNGNHAFRWHRGTVTELPPLPGYGSTYAVAINDRGEVLGGTSDDSGNYRTVLWRSNGAVVDLEARTGLSTIFALDDEGRFVGEKAGPDGMNAYPALWQDGRTTRLSNRYGAASAINDRAQVAGYYSVGESRSFTWTRGRVTDIPGLPDPGDFSFMQAKAINHSGVVVGSADFGGFRWDGTTLTQLAGLAGHGTAPSDINAAGAIVGYSGTGPDGLDPHAVLLLPRR